MCLCIGKGFRDNKKRFELINNANLYSLVLHKFIYKYRVSLRKKANFDTIDMLVGEVKLNPFIGWKTRNFPLQASFHQKQNAASYIPSNISVV